MKYHRRFGLLLALAATGSAGSAGAVDFVLEGRLESACAADFRPETQIVETFCNTSAGYDLLVHHIIVPAGAVSISWRGATIQAAADGHTSLGRTLSPRGAQMSDQGGCGEFRTRRMVLPT